MKGGNVFAEHIGNTLHPFGLSLQQFNVLRILRGRNGVAASLESITEDMIHRVSNTSRIVDKLLEKAFVKRAVCLENRRKVNIFITQKGLRLLKKIDKIINQTEETLTASLSKKEMDQLLQLLNKLKTK
jgi:DNA-binding MarR family transcriptional regulator